MSAFAISQGWLTTPRRGPTLCESSNSEVGLMKLSVRRMAVLLMTGLFVSTAFAADHRDAPTIDDYSAIDINDVYMFRDTFDNTKIVVVMTT